MSTNFKASGVLAPSVQEDLPEGGLILFLPGWFWRRRLRKFAGAIRVLVVRLS
jgi:hypothetical protein